MPVTSDLEIAQQTEQVLAWIAEGLPHSEIAVKLGVKVAVVATRIREVIAQAREHAREHVQKRFTQHDERCEYLYKVCLKRINSMHLRQNVADEWGFDDKAVRAAICVLDRQAKLLGLDRGGHVGGPNFNSWLDNQSGVELEKLAAQYGIDLPKKFSCEPEAS